MPTRSLELTILFHPEYHYRIAASDTLSSMKYSKKPAIIATTPESINPSTDNPEYSRITANVNIEVKREIHILVCGSIKPKKDATTSMTRTATGTPIFGENSKSNILFAIYKQINKFYYVIYVIIEIIISLHIIS